MLAAHLAQRAEMAFSEYVREAVCAPLELALDPTGDPGSGMHASLADVLAIGRELLETRLLAPETHDEMVDVQFPGLSGVLPDQGRFDPLDWGLGVQLNTRPPSWMGAHANVASHVSGTSAAPERFSGSIRTRDVVCAALTTREFGDWAKEAWPRFADAVLAELEGSAPRPRSVPRSRAPTTRPILGEKRAHELVERRLVAARDDARRHRGHGRRPRHVHRQRDLSEELARLQHAALSERRLRDACHPDRSTKNRSPGSPSRTRTVPDDTSSRCIRSASFPSVVAGGRRRARCERARSPTPEHVEGTRRTYACQRHPVGLPTHRRAGKPALQLGEGEGEASNENVLQSFLSGYAPKGKRRVALRLRSRTSARARTSAARRRPRRPARRP